MGSQSRYSDGRCKCDGNGNNCMSKHGQHCINQRCVIPTKKWLCEKNSGVFNKPIKRKSNMQQKATKYYAYPMNGGRGGGGGGMTAGPKISEDEAMASAPYCLDNVAKLNGCSTKFVSINPANGNCMCINEAKKTTGDSYMWEFQTTNHGCTCPAGWWASEGICYQTCANNHQQHGVPKHMHLIKENVECKDVSEINLGDKDTLQECSDACQNTDDCKYFSYGRSSKRCFYEKTTSRDCSPGTYESDTEFDFYELSRTGDGRCICNKGGDNDKCDSNFECVYNACVDKKFTVCIEAKLKSDLTSLDVGPGFSGAADLCDTCFDYIGPNPQTPGNGKCNGDRKGHATNGGNHCTGYKNNGWCHGDGGTQKWVQSVCKRMCNRCQPKKFKACAICDPCHDTVGPDANTPGDAKCYGDRKGHATNAGNHCTGYKNNGWCHHGDAQKWVRSVCPRTCGVCKSAASALADFDSFAINLDENGNYKKPCCGTYSQCCSSVRGDKLQQCKAKRLKNQVSKVCKTAIE